MDRAFELRTYHATPGKLSALEERFENHTIGLFERHGLRVEGFWRAESASDVLVYVLSAPSREEFKASWDAFQADPDWAVAKAASEHDGSLVASVESVSLVPTSFSRLR